MNVYSSASVSRKNLRDVKPGGQGLSSSRGNPDAGTPIPYKYLAPFALVRIRL
jgi:hypothetical protein